MNGRSARCERQFGRRLGWRDRLSIGTMKKTSGNTGATRLTLPNRIARLLSLFTILAQFGSAGCSQPAHTSGFSIASIRTLRQHRPTARPLPSWARAILRDARTWKERAPRQSYSKASRERSLPRAILPTKAAARLNFRIAMTRRGENLRPDETCLGKPRVC